MVWQFDISTDEMAYAAVSSLKEKVSAIRFLWHLTSVTGIEAVESAGS